MDSGKKFVVHQLRDGKMFGDTEVEPGSNIVRTVGLRQSIVVTHERNKEPLPPWVDRRSGPDRRQYEGGVMHEGMRSGKGRRHDD